MPDERVDKLLKDYFASQPAPEAAQAIDEWVREDPANARILAEFVMLDGLLLIDQKNIDATAILTSLLEAEQSAVPLTLDQQTEKYPSRLKAGQPDDQSISWQKLSSVAGYVAMQGIRHPLFVKGAIAAVLLLSAALFLVLTYTGSKQETAERPDPAGIENPNTVPPPAPNAPVATLTAEYKALWERRPGEDLYAGQRFTLTQGFAEVTTQRGAVAILEAPASIELLDSENAIHLHAGKLVGICETDTSKGFLVRTAYLDVTDLGTRFGVSVRGADVTTTVFSGKIRLSDGIGTNEVLDAEQTARFTRREDRPRLIIEGQVAGEFSALLSSPLIDPLARFRPRFEGDAMIWGGAVPKDLSLGKQAADKPQVFVEHESLELGQDVVVDLTPARPELKQGLLDDTQRVDVGTRVSVYLIHLDSLTTELVQGDYVIRFDRPILGVIGTGQRLDETDATLGVPGVLYPDDTDERIEQLNPDSGERGGRGCDLLAAGFVDRVRVEGQTLRLTLGVEGYIDQVRVLVEDQTENGTD